jgi:hypothetical protein
LSTTLAIYQPEKHHVQREEIKDVYQAQDEEILLGHLQAGNFEIPAACTDVKCIMQQ